MRDASSQLEIILRRDDEVIGYPFELEIGFRFGVHGGERIRLRDAVDAAPHMEKWTAILVANLTQNIEERERRETAEAEAAEAGEAAGEGDGDDL
jgi:hypothetical protein